MIPKLKSRTNPQASQQSAGAAGGKKKGKRK